MMSSSMDPLDSNTATSSHASPWMAVRINRTEEQTSLMMQRFTAYVVEVQDFGRNFEVSHRYGDFETLHRSLLTECPGLNLPPMPPKGVDGTDLAVVAMRKVELQKILTFMMSKQEVLMEKSLLFWKFLNMPNPALVAGRFVAVPSYRANGIKTLSKMTDVKYKDDVYRLAHPSFSDLLLEALRELGRGERDNSSWCWQEGGRGIVCTLLALALGHSQPFRTRMLDAGIVGMLLALVEREDGALDDARAALNVIVAREAERLGNILATFFARGGLHQLTALAVRPKCQEFVAKLLWLSWDAPTRAPFSTPGGQGLKLLQALLRSENRSTAIVGGVLLSGLVASGDFDADPAHRAEALRLVRSVLQNSEVAASEPQFAKTLYGGNASVVRLAEMLEDADLAPLILGLLCACRPPALKLARIGGNLAAIVADKAGGTRSEETRARAAELLLHIQGGGASSPALAASGGQGKSAVDVGPAEDDFERCVGITNHEEALESALHQQLVDGVSKTREALVEQASGVRDVGSVAEQRLRALPRINFDSFETSFSAFTNAREALDKVVKESQSLLLDMERQIHELSAARPSTTDPVYYKDRLRVAEHIGSEVKSRRADLAEADADLKSKQSRSEASSAETRRAMEDLRQLEDDLSSLRLKKLEKESEATKLRHKASTPSLSAMKEQVAERLERNIAEAKRLQVVGQRVQQGDPDYLKDGENREQKIAELSQKLQTLKKQNQDLLKEQKELDFDPDTLMQQASKLDMECSELQLKAESLEGRRFETQQRKNDAAGQSSRDLDDVRAAQERRSQLASRLSSMEAEARRVIGELQPMIQENHSGWQRLLGQQRKLESDRHALNSRVETGRRAVVLEEQTRTEFSQVVQTLIQQLQGLQSFIETVGSLTPTPSTSAVGSATLGSHTPLFNDDAALEESFLPPRREADIKGPRLESSTKNDPLDDFDNFLNEDLRGSDSFGLGAGLQVTPVAAHKVEAPAFNPSSMAEDFGGL